MSGSIEQGGVDASIPLQAGRGVPQYNPLQTLGQFAQTQNALNSLKLFPGQQQLQQQAIQGGATDLTNKNLAAAAQFMTPYLNEGTIGHDRATSILANAQAAGINIAPMVAQMANAPQADGPGFDQAFRNIVGAGALTGQGQNQINYIRPGVGPVVDNGQMVTGTQVAPQSAPNVGAMSPAGGAIQKTTSPETNAALQTVYVPDPNHPGQWLAVQQPRSALPGASGVATPGAVPPVAPIPALGTGRNGATPPAGSAPAPGASPAGAPGPLAAAPAGDQANVVKDVGQFKDDQFALPQHQQNVQSLQKAQEALQLASTGKSTATFNQIYSFLTAQGIAPQGMTDDVANWDLAHKYLLDYTRRQGAAAHSDLQLQASEGANASTDISNAAALNVVKTNIGRERQAIAQVMQAPDQTGVGYGAHAQAFSNSVDPRGFAYDTYTAQELAQIESGLKTPEQKLKFYRAVGMAQRLKLANPQPGSPTGAQPPSAAPAATAPVAPGPNGA